jgi:hypothetical protein
MCAGYEEHIPRMRISCERHSHSWNVDFLEATILYPTHLLEQDATHSYYTLVQLSLHGDQRCMEFLDKLFAASSGACHPDSLRLLVPFTKSTSGDRYLKDTLTGFQVRTAYLHKYRLNHRVPRPALI